MELTKETKILFPPELHERLTRLAEIRHTSLGELVRKACEIQYGLLPVGSRLEAVRELASLSLPVGTPEEMKQESMPSPQELMP
jgi:hypothetical protein